MGNKLDRRRVVLGALSGSVLLSACGNAKSEIAKKKIRFSYDASAIDQRSKAMVEYFGPRISSFARFEPHFNASLFVQGTELIAMARGSLDMNITSAQELAEYFPEFSIFTAGYVHRDADHQVAVFNAPLMDSFKARAENELGIKLLAVMYLGRRQLGLRIEDEINTPEDLSGVNLRMPGTSAWQFLGRSLGANPTPMAFSEVYTALQTGAIDGQDNPLPILVNSKLHEVVKQVVLTSHIVDLNYIAMSMKTWRSLTSGEQEIVQNAANETADIARKNQLELEASLVGFLNEEGVKVSTPDVEAFKDRVQRIYLESDMAKNWPDGVLDQINAL